MFLQLTQDEAESFGDYSTIQSEYPSFKTPTAVVPRRRLKETEPLLPSDSFSHSVPIAVMPSVPLNPPALNQYAFAAGLDQRPESKANPSELPHPRQIATLLFKTMPKKTYIRSLRQIHNAFAMQDVITWLKQTFPTVAVSRASVRSMLSNMLDSGWIESHTQSESHSAFIDIETSLFTFTDEAFNELEADNMLT